MGICSIVKDSSGTEKVQADRLDFSYVALSTPVRAKSLMQLTTFQSH